MEGVTPGEGGSYLLDPKTGKVQVLHKTEPANTTSESEDLNDEPAVTEAPVKGEN